jgi:RNA polymerase sigma-70 factor (ECF subfamily)
LNSDRSVAPRDLGEEWAVVQQAIAGNADAQEHLFAPHTRRLYRIAFALLHNKEDAEDALQDGLCKAYASLRSFQGRSSFSTWLTRIVINSALMARRRKSAHPEASLDEILVSQPEQLLHGGVDARPDPERTCAEVEINALVEENVRQLPPALQAAFRLHAMNGISGPESSKALGISPSAFKSRIFRARGKLACGLQRSLAISAMALVFGKRGHLMSNS